MERLVSEFERTRNLLHLGSKEAGPKIAALFSIVESCRKLGDFRYHAVPTNLKRLSGFRAEVCRTWLRALRRRSQRSKMNWDRFIRIIDPFVPRVRVLHPYPDQRFKASHPTFGKSRMR